MVNALELEHSSATAATAIDVSHFFLPAIGLEVSVCGIHVIVMLTRSHCKRSGNEQEIFHFCFHS